jgi:hypothetical protein
MKKIVKFLIGLLIFIFIAGGVSYEATSFILKREGQTIDEHPKKAENTVAQIKAFIHKENNGKSYVVVKNNGSKEFKGTVSIGNVDGIKASDRDSYVDLISMEVKLIELNSVPSEDIEPTIVSKGEFVEKEYDNTTPIDYVIIKTDVVGKGKNRCKEFYVYCIGGRDDDYIEISKRFKENYGNDYPIVTVCFVDKIDTTDSRNSLIVFAQNKNLKFSHVVFMDDLNNTCLKDERKKVDL